MARFRSKRSLPGRGMCADVRPALRAALDAGDVATAAAVLRGRPPCPVAMATDEFLLPPLDRPGVPAVPGVFGDCPVCGAVLALVDDLMASDTPERRAFITAFSNPPKEES